MSWSTTLKNRQQIRARVEEGEQIAIMFSDIRGFTSYTARQGDRAAYCLSQLHEALLKERIEDRGGIVVKTMGDGIMAAFSEPYDGVHAAIAIQQAIRYNNNNGPPHEEIGVGIGLASGTPVMPAADMIGHSVNLSQRVSSLAKGGQILITAGIKRDLPHPDGLSYISLGKRELKGLGEEDLYEVAWISEVARLSDGEDRFILILTERGTIVIGLAKEIRDHLQENFSGFKEGRKRDGRAGATATMIDELLPATGIMREQDLDRVTFSFQGNEVVVRFGEKILRLTGVDPVTAAAFQGKLADVKRRLAETRRHGLG